MRRDSGEETLTVSKPAWASAGVIGSIIVMLVGVIGVARLFIPALRDIEIDSGELAGVVTSALTLIFGAVALVGRVRAKSPVHIINRKTVPGGVFNPDAVVKKAERVQGSGSKAQGGFARLPVLAAASLWVLIGTGGIVYLEALRAHEEVPPCEEQVFPDVTETMDLTGECGGRSYAEWIKISPVVDGRPFLVRLWHSLSISFSPRASIDEDGHLRAGVAKAEIKGGTDW